MAEGNSRNLTGKALLLSFSVVCLWMMGGCSTGLVWGLVVTHNPHGAGPFAFSGIILGIFGGIGMGAYAYRLKTQRKVLTIKAATYIGVLAAIPLYGFFAYMASMEEERNSAATLQLVLFPLLVGIFVSLCVRLIANWDIREV